MTYIKRFGSLGIIIISLVAIAACLMLMLGAWFANFTLISPMLDSLSQAEKTLSEIQNVIQVADSGLGAIQGSASDLTEIAEMLSGFVPGLDKLIDFLKNIDKIQSQLDQSQENVSNLLLIVKRTKQFAPAGLIGLAFLITLGTIWFIVSQLAMIVVAWRFYTGEDLIKRWRM